MRRPLKPFVTEYKTVNRRQAANAGDMPQPEPERSAPKLFDMRTKPPAEDSYEAAMRAADALFATPAPRRPDPVPVVDDTAAAELAPVAAPSMDQPPVTTNAEPPRGRILRVIDEAPSPEYAALEAAHTPKRRGRKPGSKNKPKVAALVAEPDAPVEIPFHVDTTDEDDAYDAGDAYVQAVSPPQPSVTAAAAPRVVALPASTASRNDKRFPWVRDRLKPGEDWKRRRLPRICW